jgi:light-regulated signal transduction histidine kinase (bacteriophytochrome)
MEITEDGISHINHDLKNNIGIATTYLELLAIQQPNLATNECIVAAIESLVRANELSQEIAARCKSGETAGEIEPSNLVKIAVKEHAFANIKPSYERLRKMYPQLTINDTYKVIDDEKYMMLDQSVLPRFRENIVSNAVKANATVLDIQHEMKEHCAIITYKDNGKGMTSDKIDKLMLSRHGDGILHGLGTKSILKIAQDHGVFLSYSSEVGKGTTIRAIVPYADE